MLVEAQGRAFLSKCKGIATIITVTTALVLGVLNWFKEVRDPRVKVSYQELAKQVEGVSADIRKLSVIARQQAEEISTIQNWIIRERDVRSASPSPMILKILKETKVPKIQMPAPPTRKPVAWEVLQGVQK